MSSSDEVGKDGSCGHGSLCFGRCRTAAFAGMYRSLSVFSICEFTWYATGCVKRSEMIAPLVNVFIDDANRTRQLILQLRNYNVFFST